MRKELYSPSSPARIGISSATCSAMFVAWVLIFRISAWTAWRFVGDELLELSVADDLRVVLHRL